MDCMSPSIVCASDVLNGTKCDGIELTKNLFKDHKPSTSGAQSQSQRLETYLRIRSVPNAEPNERKQCFQVVDENTLLVIPPKGSNASKFGSDSDKKQFQFSKIFDEKVDQMFIYESFGIPIVKRFLSGENGLLFAYGITSSGKSYTMRGTTANPGIIPRALTTVFDVIGHKINKEVPNLKPSTFSDCVCIDESERKIEGMVRKFVFDKTDKSYDLLMNSFRSQISVINENTNNSILWNEVLHSTFRSDDSNMKCSVWISFYEIYNEVIYDLLDLEVTGEKKQKILLLKDDSDNYYVKGLRKICVSSAEEAYKVLLFGQNNLHISSTTLNKNSSRSHCAFNITLVSTFTNCMTKRMGFNINHLSICDLAGAERSEKANNTGERIREAGKINGSLLSLSRCISTLRHNQKFEHDSSKTRFVNFRDSKLTKVFQPFLSGNGVTAMISNMNPSPNLFDETLFALKFTGVAAQVVVSTEDQRNKFHDSLKRLTQLWMQSSERWSNFARLKPHKPSVSIIQTIKEEEEESEVENQCLDVTVEELERKIDEITQMDLSRAEPQEIEGLRNQIDFLVEKLKQTESDKFEMEVEVRRQVVSEFNKLIKEMEEMADDKDRAKKKLEEMMTQRLINSENIHKRERLELEDKIEKMKTEKFEVCEELTERVEHLNNIVSEKERQIRELESQLLLLKESEAKPKTFNDIITSPLKMDLKDVNTWTEHLEVKDCNTSAIDLVSVEMRDSNTSAIDMKSPEKCFIIESIDKAVGNSFIGLTDRETITEFRNALCDKTTNISIECTDKSTNISSDCFADKEVTIAVDSSLRAHKCISTVAVLSNDCSTSPFIANKSETTASYSSPIKHFNEEYVSKEEFNNLLTKLNKYEIEIKEKDAMIAYNRKIVFERDQRLKSLEEENQRFKMNGSEIKIEQFLKHSKPFRPNSTTSSIVSSISSMPSKSVKYEDTNSVSSVDSIQEKPNKSIKYSSRKRKPNLNTSVDRRYLSAVTDGYKKSDLDTTIEEKSSQISVNSTESSMVDEIGSDVYSTKKKSHRKASKRKPNNNSCENEGLNDYNKAPESKRKRPPLKNISCSPISPIPSGTRVTRSKAKKCIKF